MWFAVQIKWLLGKILHRHQLEITLDAELRAYMDEKTQRKILDGMAPSEARRQAILEEGGLEQVKEEVRGSLRGNGFETAVRDVRYGCRRLLRSPGFSGVVLLTLALGISTNVTMFSVMNAVLWRSLPYPAPDRLVIIEVDVRNIKNAGAAPGEVLDLTLRSHLVEHVSLISGVDANLDYGGEVEHLAAASVSDSFLPLLGANPALGRPFDSRLDDVGTVRSVLISDSLWRRRFGGNPAAVGAGVRINNLEMQIVGVLHPGFRLFLPASTNASEEIDVWFPTGLGKGRQYRGFAVAARLKPGVTIVQANAELQSLAADFVREYPGDYSDGKLRLVAHPLHSELTRAALPVLYMLAGAVAFVLLIACVNVANVMLANGTARQREIAIRRAMGAGRARLIRQLVTENVVLAVLAGGIGLILAHISLTATTKLSNSHLPMQSRITLDGSVTLFTVLLSIGTCLVFGILPAWRLASGDTASPLRAGRADTAAPSMRMLQRVLVIAEVALSIVPLVCGGLMLRTFLNLVHAPIGFEPSGVLTAKLPISFRMYPTIDQRWSLHRNILEQVGAIPGVEAVSAASPLPFAPLQITRRVGRADDSGVPGILATQQTVLHGYLRLVGTPLLQGRDFTPEDIAARRPVAIVDQRVAQRLWPEGALGRRLAIETGATRVIVEIVGIIAPVRVTHVRDGAMPHFLVPYHLYPIEMSLIVKTRETTASLGPAIRRTVDGLHTGRSLFEIRPMSAYVADSIGDIRFTMLVLGVFATISVLLASVGLYGTLSYLISQRRREFGIRLALGSSVRGLVAMVVGEGTVLTAAGIVAGLLGAWAATRAIRQLLYEVSPLDRVTLLGVIGLIAFISIAAVSVPAWRVTRIDPNLSLRCD
jgi:predicted permease